MYYLQPLVEIGNLSGPGSFINKAVLSDVDPASNALPVILAPAPNPPASQPS